MMRASQMADGAHVCECAGCFLCVHLCVPGGCDVIPASCIVVLFSHPPAGSEP